MTVRASKRPKREASIVRALFGRQAAQFGADWPTTRVLGRTRLASWPEPFRTGELSSVEALSTAYTGKLQVTGARTRSGGVRRSQFSVQGSAFDFYMNGMTVFFADIGACVPSVRPWLTQFEEEIGMPAGNLRLTAFATPGEKKGLPFHYDNTDNVIIQVRGKKRIWVADNPTVAYPLTFYNPGFGLVREDLLPRQGKEPPWKQQRPKLFVLEPGMVILVPAGMWHATEHFVDSYSWSLVFEWPRTADLVLSRLRMELLQHPEWRRPLYGAWSTDQRTRAQAEKRLSTTLAKLNGQPAPIQAADALAETPSLAASAIHFRADTKFYRAPFTKFALRSLGGGVTELRVHSTRSYDHSVLELPTGYVPACRWIAKQKLQFSLGELVAHSGVDLDAARDLLSALLQVGIVARVSFRPAADLVGRTVTPSGR